MRITLLTLLCVTLYGLQAQTIKGWEKLDYGLTRFQPYSITETASNVFAVAYGKLYKADDNLGNRWSEVSGLPDNYTVDLIRSSTELLVVLLNENKHITSGFGEYEMYVSEDEGESFYHARKVIYEKFGRNIINVSGRIITYDDGDTGNLGNPRFHVSYNAGRSWEELTDYSIRFMRETEPGVVMKWGDEDILEKYNATTQNWDEITVPENFIQRDFFTLGDTIATIRDYTLYLFVPNENRVFQEPTNIQVVPRYLRKRGNIYLAKISNTHVGSNRGRNWEQVFYSSPASLTSQGRYTYAAKDGILFFCNDFEAFDVGDPTEALRPIGFLQGEAHFGAVRKLAGTSFMSSFSQKALLNFHDSSGAILDEINAINFNTAQTTTINQSLVATYPEGVRIRESDGTSRVVFAGPMYPSTLQCIEDRCVFISWADELIMSEDGGENWFIYSISGYGSFQDEPLILQKQGLYFGTTGSPNEIVYYHDFSQRTASQVGQFRFRDIASRISFRSTDYNLWFTGAGIYRAEDDAGNLELLDADNFPIIKYFFEAEELARVRNATQRGDSIIVTGTTKRPFVSTDRGDSWIEWEGPLPSGRINDAILVGGKFVLATDSGLYIESNQVSNTEKTASTSIPQVVCFPNPASIGESIQLELPRGLRINSATSIALFSTDGSLVVPEQKYTTANGRVTIDGISQPGSYYLVGHSDDTWFTSLVIID